MDLRWLRFMRVVGLQGMLLAVLLGALLSNTCWADPYKDAANKAAQAFYQYEHWDEDISKFLQHYENQLTPEEKKIGGWVGFGIRCFMDQRVEFTYHF